KNFISNQWVSALANQTLPVVDPSTGEEYAEIARSGDADIETAVRAARGAFEGEWGAMAPAQRSRLLLRLSMALEEHQDELARIESRDTGKPLRKARSDAAAVARYFEFYAGAVDKLHGHTIPYPRDYTVFTLREPHGVTGHIVPWNYPLQI